MDFFWQPITEHAMLQKKWLPLSIVLGGLALGIATVWLFWTQQLTPIEARVIGTWISLPQRDGFSTLMLVRPDRTCQVRWLDGAGNDTKPGHPPRDSNWWIDGTVLFVDVAGQPSWFEPGWWDFQGREKTAVLYAWRFAIQEESLVLGRPKYAPITLRRQQDAPP
jgi:hypothetical protein